jgi:prolyl-tRNA synthetase
MIIKIEIGTFMTESEKKVKQAKTAITPTRAENFPEWYQTVIKAADLAENAPVRGCMIIKPYGYAIWENIQKQFDAMIKAESVKNAYFPLLIPLSFIAKEAEHIDGFAKECAVVTHHRLAKNDKGELAPDPNSQLAEPMIIRPTSETIIGEAFSKWVQSYRDLPLKINQWANVMRWEMRPRIFLRTAEFLWQEGHNVFGTDAEADQDARRMLEVYREFLENYLAIPVIPGCKTPEERFPGAIETYTVEAFMQDGKALQSATSHHLGQTFAKSANIQFLDKDGTQKIAWTTSWGMSTRTIGGLIMTHADDDGLICPPKVAPYQVGILPIVHQEADREKVMMACSSIQKQLQALGVSADIDHSEQRTGDKMWAAIKKGVPVRLEVGARELAEDKVTYTRRDLGKDSKKTVSTQEFIHTVSALLGEMHQQLLNKARARTQAMIHEVQSLKAMKEFFAADRLGAVKIDYSLVKNSAEFEAISKEFALSARCLPFSDEGKQVIVGKAY